ncbi:MAG TPA: EAL domain-containing protein, partial [Gemmatimonadales bacterium]|nr:EAL domain-containing protein [Gemmatimonadales bacterium]
METLAPSEFHQLLDAAPDAMVVVDRYGRVTALNLEAERFLGWTENELRGEPMSRLIPTRFHPLLGSDLEANGGSPGSTEGRRVSCFAQRRDGSEFPVELARRPLGEGTDAHSLVTLRDLTQWRRAQEQRSRNNDQARATLDSIGDAVITTDATGRITYLNPVAERMTGWGALEALGQSLDAVLPLLSEASRQPVANSAMRCLGEGRSIDLEDGVVLLRRDGTEVPIGDSAAPVRDRLGATVGVVIVIQDESEKRRIGRRLSFEATHDVLTGLINRREFERRLTRVVTDLAGAAGEHVLLCLDLDRLKLVNDTSGHDAGDDLLRGLSALLSRHMRKRDTLARLGGDEFGVLLENCPLAEAERIAENLRAEVEQFHFEWDGKAFSISASIGLTPLTAEAGGIAAVLRAADAACYSAKESGGNRVHIERLGRDSAAMSQTMARRVTRLARAVDEGHFRLYAQPIVPLQPEPPARPRFEILLRLPDGQGGIQAAADFLPQAARCNLMPAIDRWVIRETIALLGQWHREYPDSELPVCSINLSGSALAEDSLLLLVEQLLSKGGIPAGTLCFEIAETAALANLARTVRFLSGIRATGCGVALEDFGNGMTSFTYLKTLPVDFLKIGGQVVRDVVADPVYGSIISAVDQIGRSMGISTIAKQVGSQPVLRKLRALGIGYAQGRALTPPVPLTDSEGRLMIRSLRPSGG